MLRWSPGREERRDGDCGPVTPGTRRDGSLATTSHGHEVLRQLHACLGETARALSAEPGAGGSASDRARAAVAAVESARRALAPVLEAVAGTGAPPVERVVTLPPDDAAARHARTACREALEVWSLTTPAAQAAVDVASELVTNAARATRRPVELRLALTADDLVVSTWDDGPGRPRLLPYRPGRSDRGMGLHWVQSLTTSWGWQEEGAGKRVWAVVRLDG